MAVSLDDAEAFDLVRREGSFGAASFALVGAVARLTASDETRSQARELYIRILDRRRDLDESCWAILDSLAVELGLFPYVQEQSRLFFGDCVATEFHRPENSPRPDFLFHGPQKQVFDRVVSGQNTILSAPTSFGKSAIIDALVLSEKWRTIVIIVPTLALIDETRRRLTRLKSRYKVITNATQQPADWTLYILTQERFLDLPEMPSVDFFIVDEFYKLDAADSRSALLNIAFDRLHSTGAQYYMIGPSIDKISENVPRDLRGNFVKEDFRTVTANRSKVNTDDERTGFISKLSELDGQTLIYVRTPERAREVAEWILADSPRWGNASAQRAAEWTSATYDARWSVARCLVAGVGIHHGQMPRALQHHILRHFNSGDIKYLVCTSTLIEGVNTSAKNVLILDTRRRRKLIDYFTFNNISGRAGRMSTHYVGEVILFDEEPQEEQTEVDFPIQSQSDRASTSALLSLPPERLTRSSRLQLASFLESDVLSVETLKRNSGVDPAGQIEVARLIEEDLDYYHGLLAWTGLPTRDQRFAVCELIWKHLVPPRDRGRVSPTSLAIRIDLIRQHGASVPAMIEDQIRYVDGNDPNAAAESVMWFLRNWASFSFPAMLGVLDRIQNEVFGKFSYTSGNYGFYASQVENLFLPQFAVTLEEYGLPYQVAIKLFSGGLQAESLDQLLADLGDLALTSDSAARLTPYELEMLADVQYGLGTRN